MKKVDVDCLKVLRESLSNFPVFRQKSPINLQLNGINTTRILPKSRYIFPKMFELRYKVNIDYFNQESMPDVIVNLNSFR
jgi:hypothetical protein